MAVFKLTLVGKWTQQGGGMGCGGDNIHTFSQHSHNILTTHNIRTTFSQHSHNIHTTNAQRTHNNTHSHNTDGTFEVLDAEAAAHAPSSDDEGSQDDEGLDGLAELDENGFPILPAEMELPPQLRQPPTPQKRVTRRAVRKGA